MSKSSSKKIELFFSLALIFWASASLALAPASVDTDKDGIEDSRDLDDDGDGIFDSVDAFPTNPNNIQKIRTQTDCLTNGNQYTD